MNTAASDRIRGFQNRLDEVLELLDEEHLAALIDDRIDQAVVDFCMTRRQTPPQSPSQLISQAAGFIAFLREQGGLLPVRMTDCQARSEAVDLIDRCFAGQEAFGFETACLEALRRGPEGLALIESHLITALKNIERSRYIHWQLARCVAVLDWDGKRVIVQILLRKFEGLLPPFILKRPPGLLVGILPDLILDLARTRSDLKQLLVQP